MYWVTRYIILGWCDTAACKAIATLDTAIGALARAVIMYPNRTVNCTH
jgi:hypothetical protein